MKVFNLTDVATKELTQRQLVGHSFAVGDKMLAPGTSEDINDETMERVRHELQQLISLGALACNEPPAEYLVAKSKAPAKEAAPALVRLPAEAPSADAASAETSDDPSRPAKGRKER